MSASRFRSVGGRAVAIAIMCTFLPFATTGCFGGFELTKKAYKVNQEIDPDKWVQWGTFVVMSVCQIYTAAYVIDAVFANSVEFWTGKNPVMANATRSFEGEHGELVSATFRPGGIVDVQVTEADGTVHSITLMREHASIVAVGADGRFLARVGDLDGEPALLMD